MSDFHLNRQRTFSSKFFVRNVEFKDLISCKVENQVSEPENEKISDISSFFLQKFCKRKVCIESFSFTQKIFRELTPS